MTEKFKKSYCQGIRLVLCGFPLAWDPLTLDLKTNKNKKCSQDMRLLPVSDLMCTNAQD